METATVFKTFRVEVKEGQACKRNLCSKQAGINHVEFPFGEIIADHSGYCCKSEFLVEHLNGERNLGQLRSSAAKRAKILYESEK